jgi:stringent starvation protein B
LYVPIGAVRGLFARENGQGMFFETEATETDTDAGEIAEQNPVAETTEKLSTAKKPFLKLVK